jgi:hypothetical protein
MRHRCDLLVYFDTMTKIKVSFRVCAVIYVIHIHPIYPDLVKGTFS